MGKVKAGMAGTILRILVTADDTVAANQEVAVLESMKMEVPIVSAESGTVRNILVREGDFVNEGDDILELE